MAGYSILGFNPMHSFKFIRTWSRFI